MRPPNGGRNEANSWETGSEYSSGETYTAAAMRAAGRHRPAGSRGLRAHAGPCTLGYTNVVAVALAKTAAIVRKCAFSPSAYQISLKSDDFRLRYSDKTIFKMAAVRHLEVSKFGILVMYPVLERDSALSYKISR